jgi:hypothetical protein
LAFSARAPLSSLCLAAALSALAAYALLYAATTALLLLVCTGHHGAGLPIHSAMSGRVAAQSTFFGLALATGIALN